jgi:hypothetical protein
MRRVLCQTLIFGCGTLRAPAMGVVFCPSFHALRTSERATRRRRPTPILSFDKALGSVSLSPTGGPSRYLDRLAGLEQVITPAVVRNEMVGHVVMTEPYLSLAIR